MMDKKCVILTTHQIDGRVTWWFVRLKFYRKIYTEFIRMDIKRIMMYPIDFVLGNMGFFLETISTLFVLYIIVMNTGFLGEFSGYQVLFFLFIFDVSKCSMGNIFL